MSDDLVAFLRARLDEDYEAARLVLGVNVMAGLKRGKPAPRWVPSPEGDAAIWDTDGTPRVKFVWARERDHIIRHDPARVLTEVEAKRALLDEHARVWLENQWIESPPDGRRRLQSVPVCRTCEPPKQLFGPAWPCRTLRLLALPYAEHPDYRDEWRP